MKKVKVTKKRFMRKPIILNGTLLSNINECDENIIGAKNYYKTAIIGIIIPMIIAAFLGPHFEIRTSSFYMWLIAGLAINCSAQCKKVSSY